MGNRRRRQTKKSLASTPLKGGCRIILEKGKGLKRRYNGLEASVVEYPSKGLWMTVALPSFAKCTLVKWRKGHYITPEDRKKRQRIRFETVADSLVCSVCLEVPSRDPTMVRACHHVFCESCIRKCLDAETSNGTCPICRSEISNPEDDLLPLEEGCPFAHRLWSNIPVRCEHRRSASSSSSSLSGCSWIGSMGGYQIHRETCAHHEETDRLKARVRTLEGELRAATDPFRNRKTRGPASEQLRGGDYDSDSFVYGSDSDGLLNDITSD